MTGQHPTDDEFTELLSGVWPFVTALLMVAVSVPVFAQRHGGGGPPRGMQAGGGMSSGLPAGSSRNGEDSLGAPSGGSPSSAPAQRGSMTTISGGLQLGPAGRWWDDKHFAKALHLRAEQQKRMDEVFNENRAILLSRFQSLQQEEAKLERLSNAHVLDEAALFAEIDRVSQARADLEKEDTHLIVQVRKEMDADQIERLADYR